MCLVCKPCFFKKGIKVSNPNLQGIWGTLIFSFVSFFLIVWKNCSDARGICRSGGGGGICDWQRGGKQFPRKFMSFRFPAKKVETQQQ